MRLTFLWFSEKPKGPPEVQRNCIWTHFSDGKVARWILHGSCVFSRYHFPAPSISCPFHLHCGSVCINRTIWKASAARSGNVNRLQRNITPAGVWAMERWRGRKKERADWFDGYRRMESEGLACCGMRQGSASGELPPWWCLKQLIKSRLKGWNSIQTRWKPFLTLLCSDANMQILLCVHINTHFFVRVKDKSSNLGGGGGGRISMNTLTQNRAAPK